MSKLDVSIEDAFSTGVREGARATLKEVLALLDDTPEFVKKYAELKLQYIEMVESFIKNSNGNKDDEIIE